MNSVPAEDNARGLLEFYRQDTSDIVPPSREAFLNRVLIFLGLEYQILKVSTTHTDSNTG